MIVELTDIELFKTAISVIGVLLGGAALSWNVYNYRQTAIGYMKLKLECNYAQTSHKKYIISKTAIENTGRKPISVSYSFVLVINHASTFEEAMRVINSQLVQNADSKKQIDLKKIFEYLLKSVFDTLKEGGLVLKALPYYYVLNERLGSHEVLATSHTQEIMQEGVYSIFFCVIGKDLYRGNPSAYRLVHDEIVIPSC